MVSTKAVAVIDGNNGLVNAYGSGDTGFIVGQWEESIPLAYRAERNLAACFSGNPLSV